MRWGLLGVMLGLSGGTALAQPASCPDGQPMNPNLIFRGTGACTLAKGDETPQLNGSGKVLPTFLVNYPVIAPSSTTVATSATQVYPAASAIPNGAYLSIRIFVLTPGASLTCTGDGGATSGTAAYPQHIDWPDQPGGAMPPGPIVCTATATATIASEAH
jgi:hypothetical protein